MAPISGGYFARIDEAADTAIIADTGGTTYDVSLIRRGEVPSTRETWIGQPYRGHMTGFPSVDVKSVGAGGGSIAWIDDGGLLRMGPQSAGADPGPACYGRGGAEPTCTDANLVLGYLSAEFFAGGRMKLDLDSSKKTIGEKIAKPLGMTLVEAAHGMYQVINVNMASAIREISVQKGYDPREFPLICAGGAGPVHGAAIAAELGVKRIVVPRDASIFCAGGMLRTDLKHDYVRSFAQPLPNDRDARVQALLAEMTAQARKTLDGEGIPRNRQRLRISMDLRYLGQYHEVSVSIPEKWDWKTVRELFHAQHDRLYGYALREEGTAVVLLNLRLTAIGVTEKPRLVREPRRKVKALKGKRPVYLPERKRFASVPVYDGDRLGHGNRLAGPAIIESVNTSILVPPRHVAEYDALGNCILSTK